MDINPYSKMNTDSIIPSYILEKSGDFIFMGLHIEHNGRGRVIISDAMTNVLLSDSDYYSPSDVIGTINNIIETKSYGRRY
ncbi:MAG: hypothetical protein WC346_14960 [Methanogenium sp.]|jgi:hypothetical protein